MIEKNNEKTNSLFCPLTTFKITHGMLKLKLCGNSKSYSLETVYTLLTVPNSFFQYKCHEFAKCNP